MPRVMAPALVLAVVAGPATALTMKCDRPARTAEFAATSSVAKTEADADCFISVDGAASAPTLDSVARATAACVARLHNPAGTYTAQADPLARFVVPVLAAASAPGFKGDASTLPKPPKGDEAACLAFLDDLAARRQAYSALSPFGPLVDEIAECLAVPRDAHGTRIACERPKGGLVLRFRTELGAHVVRLPYPE